jgi:hypothetical protein
MVNRVAIQSVPSSWAAADWDSKAPGVYPGSARRARKLLKVHRSALLAHGALGRVGRGIVIPGGWPSTSGTLPVTSARRTRTASVLPQRWQRRVNLRRPDMDRRNHAVGDRSVDYFRLLTPAEQAESIRRLATSGLTDYDIAAATRLHVEQVRRVIGPRRPESP